MNTNYLTSHTLFFGAYGPLPLSGASPTPRALQQEGSLEDQFSSKRDESSVRS